MMKVHIISSENQEETVKQITTIGLDTSKHVFHVVGLNKAGRVVLRKQLSRRRLLPFFAQLPASLVGIETSGGSHHWARELRSLGHTVRLIPARDVRALLRGQKNDYHDALAIAEALSRPQQRFTAIRSIADHDLQALHRLRRGYLDERTAVCNRLRGLLAEYGIVIPKGISTLRRRLPELLEDAAQPLTDFVRQLLWNAWQHLRALDQQVQHCDEQLRVQLKADIPAQRLLQIPGFGPVVASTWRARMGDGRQFHCGRDAAAACGLVPRQHTTGGRPQLLGITKCGDKELRSLLIHGARSVVIHAHRKDDALSRWVCGVKARRGIHKATVALANKMARIAWAMSATETDYQVRLAA